MRWVPSTKLPETPWDSYWAYTFIRMACPIERVLFVLYLRRRDAKARCAAMG